MATRLGTLAALTLSLVFAHPAPVRAQLSLEELKTLDKLLAEPDDAAGIARRLALFGEAIAREGDPKRRLSTSYVIDLRRARIPAADGVPFLLAFLDHPAEVTKRRGLGLLGDYEAGAKPAVPRIRQLMDDPILAVGADAMFTLARIDPGDGAHAAAMLDRLGSKKSDDSTDRMILSALIRMAAVVPKSAVPRIAKFREHRWTENCLYAYEAVGKVLALERPTLDQLRTMEAIDWRNTADQGYASLAAIQEAGPKAAFAIPLLVELLSGEPPVYVQCVALDALGKLKIGHPRLISLLLERLAVGDLVLREKARRNLFNVDLTEPASVRALAKGLRHADRYVRYEAAAHLRSWDQESKLSAAGLAEMFTPLIETLREVDEDVPWGNLDVYLSLLKHFGRKAAPVAETMVRLHTSPTYFAKVDAKTAAERRARLLAVLANIGVPDTALPLVVEALKSGPTAGPDAGYGYAAAARALAACPAAEARAAIPWLLPALTATGEEPKFMYIDWTSKIGYPYTTARLEAIRALGKIGPDAKEALAPLKAIAAAKDADPRTLEARAQQEARRAVAAIEGKPGSEAK